MSYHDDTLEAAYNEIQKLENEILEASLSLKPLGAAEANAIAEYEDKKNRLLIELYAEESKPTFGGKRTEAHRTAMYRKAFQIERLQKQLASHELKAQQDYIRSLLTVMSAKQSRLRILDKVQP